MCIIIVPKPGTAVPDAHIRESLRLNGDGFGLAYAKGGILHMSKGLVTHSGEITKILETAKPHPTIIHFRKSTHGTVCKENCHPFRVNNRCVLVHNGVINLKTKGTESDTAAFVRWLQNIMHRLKTEDPLDPRIVAQQKSFISWSILTYLFADGTVRIHNRTRGHELNDIWYSNYSYSVGNYSGNYNSNNHHYSGRHYGQHATGYGPVGGMWANRGFTALPQDWYYPPDFEPMATGEERKITSRDEGQAAMWQAGIGAVVLYQNQWQQSKPELCVVMLESWATAKCEPYLVSISDPAQHYYVYNGTFTLVHPPTPDTRLSKRTTAIKPSESPKEGAPATPFRYLPPVPENPDLETSRQKAINLLKRRGTAGDNGPRNPVTRIGFAPSPLPVSLDHLFENGTSLETDKTVFCEWCRTWKSKVGADLHDGLVVCRDCLVEVDRHAAAACD